MDIRKPGDADPAFCCLSVPRMEPKADESEWATATRRVLLYLKALGVPPRDSLSLAQEALNLAERTPASPPVQAAMVALKTLLHTHSASDNGPAHGWTLPCERCGGGPAAVPPGLPGEMAPARIDRRPWLTFLLRCTGRRPPFPKKTKAGRKGVRGDGLRSLTVGVQGKEETGRAK